MNMLEEIYDRQTVSEKAGCQKGHNPDQKLRSQIISKCKRGVIRNLERLKIEQNIQAQPTQFYITYISVLKYIGISCFYNYP